jgi:hypothetical protein
MSPQDRPLGPAVTPIVTLGAVSRPGKSKAEECGRTLTTLCLGVRFGVSKKNFSCFILGVVSLSSFISVPDPLPWIISPCDYPFNRKRRRHLSSHHILDPFFCLC